MEEPKVESDGIDKWGVSRRVRVEGVWYALETELHEANEIVAELSGRVSSQEDRLERIGETLQVYGKETELDAAVRVAAALEAARGEARDQRAALAAVRCALGDDLLTESIDGDLLTESIDKAAKIVRRKADRGESLQRTFEQLREMMGAGPSDNVFQVARSLRDRAARADELETGAKMSDSMTLGAVRRELHAAVGEDVVLLARAHRDQVEMSDHRRAQVKCEVAAAQKQIAEGVSALAKIAY